MYISHVKLNNWRNFQSADVDLSQRVFIVGPNASGKSNFLDVFRFLHDLAKHGGGLQAAMEIRGGMAKVLSFSGRRASKLEISVEISDLGKSSPKWRYELGIRKKSAGSNIPVVDYERVLKNGDPILSRPNLEDKTDKERLEYTLLEQISTNIEFRDVARCFESISYQHLIPQLIRQPDIFSGRDLPEDPYGKTFLNRILQTPDKVRDGRMKKIRRLIELAVPDFVDLREIRDTLGQPHLMAMLKKWGPNSVIIQEDLFSDGTIRLLGLLWALFEGNGPLLVEEPELSLHAGVIRLLPEIFYEILRDKKRQIILTTHSAELLSDKGIGGEEVIMLTPGKTGTIVENASSRAEFRALLEGGLSVADAVLPATRSRNLDQMAFPFQ